MNIIAQVKAEKVNQNDTKYVTALLCLFQFLNPTGCPGSKSKEGEYVLAAEVLEIRAKFDLMLPWFQKGTTLVLTRLTCTHTLFSLVGPYSFNVRKRWMAFNQKGDSTFKLSALHHSCLTIILFMVSEDRLLVVLRFDKVQIFLSSQCLAYQIFSSRSRHTIGTCDQLTTGELLYNKNPNLAVSVLLNTLSVFFLRNQVNYPGDRARLFRTADGQSREQYITCLGAQ